MGRQISLFSNDEVLIRLLRATVAEVLGADYTVEAGDPPQAPFRNDLCIWDFVPEETIFPSGYAHKEWRRHLFLIERKHLGALRVRMGASNLNILLKPVTQIALRAFLGGYGLHRGEAGDDSGDHADVLRSERDEMLQVLMQTNLKLQEFNHEISNFLARSIHDFRAPLTAISGYCELLLEEALGALTPDQREVLGRMQHSVRRLTRAADSMLQLGVAQNADKRMDIQRGNIRDCIDQALQSLSPVLENKQISVTLDVEPSPDGLMFEKSRIEQTLVNLVESACKFTPRGGSIEIRGYPYFWERRSERVAPLLFSVDRRVKEVTAGNTFRVDIRDSGPGIPAVRADKIFEEYSSYSGGQDRSGAGLGLAICRMILSQHGGRVWAESSAEGGVFSFVLPVQQNGSLARPEKTFNKDSTVAVC